MKFLLWLIPSEIERTAGRLLCLIGRHKMRVSSSRWGVYRIWYNECARLDCDHQEPTEWEQRQ